MSSTHAPSAMCDLVKVLRGGWFTHADLEELTGFHRQTIYTWINEMARQGLVLTKQGQRQGARGRLPTYFSLSPEWGGQAQ